METRLGIDQSRGYRRAAFVSVSLVAVFCGGMAMQAYRQNQDGIRSMSETPGPSLCGCAPKPSLNVAVVCFRSVEHNA